MGATSGSGLATRRRGPVGWRQPPLHGITASARRPGVEQVKGSARYPPDRQPPQRYTRARHDPARSQGCISGWRPGNAISSRPPRRCPRKCCRWWTSPSSSMPWRRRRRAGIEEFIFVTGPLQDDDRGSLRSLPTSWRARCASAARPAQIIEINGWLPKPGQVAYNAPAAAPRPRPRGSGAPRDLVGQRALRGAARRRT